jgi:hypothetical protein
MNSYSIPEFQMYTAYIVRNTLSCSVHDSYSVYIVYKLYKQSFKAFRIVVEQSRTHKEIKVRSHNVDIDFKWAREILDEASLRSLDFVIKFGSVEEAIYKVSQQKIKQLDNDSRESVTLPYWKEVAKKFKQ